MSDHEATLPALLEQLASHSGAEAALYEGDRTLTFGELATCAARLSAGLADLGLGRGDVLAVWLPNSIAWVEATFAGCRRGAVVLGVNTRYRAVEVMQALTDSGARVLVTWPGFHGIDFLGMLAEVADELPDTLAHIVTVGDVDPETIPATLRARVVSRAALVGHEPDGGVRVDPDAPGFAFSSSGSTSTPKLVLHSQRGMVTHSSAVARAFGYAAPDTVVLGTLPFCGVFGFNTLMAALVAGRPVVIQDVFTADGAVELIRRHGVTHTNLADEMLRRIAAAAPLESMPSWREAGFGNFTATDPHELVRAGDAAGKRFFQTYGSSEVFALMCYPAPEAGAERRARGGGVPVSEDIRFRIRDPETGRLAEPGRDGEIEIGGFNVTIGYLNRPGIEDLGPDGYFRTGDLGREGAGRDLVYLSRRGDALRLGGFLVSPREIEAFLEELPGITAAQLVGVDAGAGAVPVAFVLAEDAVDEHTVIERCRSSLAHFKVPRRIVVLDEFPIVAGTNGDKIQRNELRALATEALAAPTTGGGVGSR